MQSLDIYEGLSLGEQILHGLHFMLCAFAVLIGCVPMITDKGSLEHKFAGMIYLPLSLVALLLASFMAWRESSSILFCFNSFSAYLLMRGWRAVHEEDGPKLLDWVIPGSLFVLAVAVTLHACIYDEGRRSFYLLFFAMNAFYLSWRDWQHLRRRAVWIRTRIMFAGLDFGKQQPGGWMGRHAAGMVGSVIANLSVVVLTLLPVELHWMWPTMLLAMTVYVAWKQREKKMQLRRAMGSFGKTI